MPHPGAQTLSTKDLVGQIAGKATLLVKEEIELAKTELHADLRSEVKMAKGLGVAVAAGLLTLAMLLVSGVLALATVMTPWLAALAVAGGTLLVSGVAAMVGWSKRVKAPLEMTRKTLREDIQWAKERMA